MCVYVYISSKEKRREIEKRWRGRGRERVKERKEKRIKDLENLQMLVLVKCKNGYRIASYLQMVWPAPMTYNDESKAEDEFVHNVCFL